MSLPITGLYGAILMIFAIALSAKAGGYRGKSGVSLLFGDPVNMELAQRVRVHQNFLEYVPMAIILMGILELNGGSATFLHVFGIVLIVSRIAHAIGLRHDNMGHPGRTIGTAGTVLFSAAAALYSLWIVIGPMLG